MSNHIVLMWLSRWTTHWLPKPRPSLPSPRTRARQCRHPSRNHRSPAIFPSSSFPFSFNQIRQRITKSPIFAGCPSCSSIISAPLLPDFLYSLFFLYYLPPASVVSVAFCLLFFSLIYLFIYFHFFIFYFHFFLFMFQINNTKFI